MALSSKKLYFRYNATNYDLPLFSEKATSCTLSIREGNETLYALADRPEIENIDYTENNIRYFYNSDKPTIHYWQDGYRRNCFNDSEQAITYDIPAGTYTPSAFESLISTFIGRNTKRQVANGFSVTVGGAGSGTVQCLAGSYIGYSNPTQSPYAAYPHSVRFNYTGTAANLTYPPYWSSGLYFRNNGIYITYAITGQSVNVYNFNGYANFNISVTTGIKFV